MATDHVKRADAVLTIAQYKFKQALKKDERPLSVECSTQFCDALDAVLRQNTPANIQTCKRWIVQHVAPSSSRIPVLGEYLVAVSRSIFVDRNAKSPKASRNRLDILLVVSDVLHADKFHERNYTAEAWVAGELKPYIEDLVELAALAAAGKDTPHEKKLKAVINFWAANKCISADEYGSFRERVADGLVVAQGGTPVRKRTYALPEHFGDRNAPWHELPASYMVDRLIERPNEPIAPNLIRVARLERRQASERVRNLLEEYFDNIDLKYMPTGDNPTGETKKYKLWLDPMGQLVKQDKATGETKTVCNGYGWSVKFCQDMQENQLPETIAKKREEFNENIRLIEETRREEALRKQNSPSLSPSPPRRRRYSSSVSDRGSDDDRPESRDSGRDRRYHPRRRASRDGDRTSERGSRFDDSRESDRNRHPSGQYSRNAPPSEPQWTNQSSRPQDFRKNYARFGNNGNANYIQGYPQVSQKYNNAPGFIPPQPLVQGQYSGYPVHQFQPPAPPHSYYQGGQVPPPIPPQLGVGGPQPSLQSNYNGAYNPPPNMVGQPGHAYFQGGNNPTYGGQGNNNTAYNSPGGYGGQPQGGFRGGFGGGFQGRGGHRGGNQGQRTGRRRF